MDRRTAQPDGQEAGSCPESQDFRLWMAGLARLIAGIILLLVLPQFLPFSAGTRCVMGGQVECRCGDDADI